MNERKEIIYLTTQSTHFNLRLYGIGHIVMDLSGNERRNPLPPINGLLFLTNSTIYRKDSTYRDLCHKGCGELAKNERAGRYCVRVSVPAVISNNKDPPPPPPTHTHTLSGSVMTSYVIFIYNQYLEN